MASTKINTKKKNILDDNIIISLYMDYVQKNNLEPKNIYIFCKEHEIEEIDFYSFFGSFDGIKQSIWNKFLENTIVTIDKDEAYISYSDKDKLLTLFFTLFEILTLNRSYVLYTLKENKQGFKNLKDLKEFRNHFKDFINTNVNSGGINTIGKLDKITKPMYAEGAWIQFLFILKFWIEDTSKGFEKTDVMIEKSVNTAVDLLNTKPLESLIDLGKFLWNEKKM